MLRLRILSALVMIPLALGALYIGSPAFDLLVLAAAMAMTWEWTRLVHGGRFAPAGWITLAAAIATVVLVAADVGGWAFLAIVLGGIGAGFAARLGGDGRGMLWAVFGVFYICLPAAAILWLRSSTVDGFGTVAWLFAVVWASDIGAYFAGSAIGGPRLAPAISPNKTWAGAAGGAILAAVAGGVIAGLLDVADIWMPAAAGIALSLAAQAGDLFESRIKRMFGAKDAGTLIPGHGGVLDRVDGLVAAAPAVVLLDWLTGGAFLSWQ